MKHFKILLLVALLGASPLVSAKTIVMEVNGLVCAFCAQGIEKTLKEIPATEAVFVSLEHRTVAVKLKDGADIDDAVLRKAITASGYSVVEIRRTDETLDAIRQRAKSDD